MARNRYSQTSPLEALSMLGQGLQQGVGQVMQQMAQQRRMQMEGNALGTAIGELMGEGDRESLYAKGLERLTDFGRRGMSPENLMSFTEYLNSAVSMTPTKDQINATKQQKQYDDKINELDLKLKKFEYAEKQEDFTPDSWKIFQESGDENVLVTKVDVGDVDKNKMDLIKKIFSGNLNDNSRKFLIGEYNKLYPESPLGEFAPTDGKDTGNKFRMFILRELGDTKDANTAKYYQDMHKETFPNEPVPPWTPDTGKLSEEQDALMNVVKYSYSGNYTREEIDRSVDRLKEMGVLSKEFIPAYGTKKKTTTPNDDVLFPNADPTKPAIKVKRKHVDTVVTSLMKTIIDNLDFPNSKLLLDAQAKLENILQVSAMPIDGTTETGGVDSWWNSLPDTEKAELEALQKTNPSVFTKEWFYRNKDAQ